MDKHKNTICPYFKYIIGNEINCKRGHEKEPYKAKKLNKHIAKKCCGHYTSCSNYKKLQEKGW